MDTAPRSGCPINAAVEVLGDPWATLVLRNIVFGNRRHFRKLRAAYEAARRDKTSSGAAER